MNRRWQALQFCLDSSVIVVVQIVNKFLFEVLHGLELLQIKQLAFKQAEKVFSYRVVQTVSFPAHALPDSLCFEHTLVQLVLVYMCLREKSVGFRPRHLFVRSRLAGDFVHSALPVTGNELLWGVGFSVSTAIIGRLGSQFTAANSIATVVMNILTVFVFGTSAATAVTIGRTIGAGRAEDAARMAHMLLGICCGLGAVLGLFSVSAETRDIAYDLLTIMALLAPLQAFSNNMMVGVLRGGGDVKVNFLLDCGTMWLVSVPMGLLAGFVWKLDPPFVFLLMRCDYLAQLTLGCLRLRSGRWIRVMT